MFLRSFIFIVICTFLPKGGFAAQIKSIEMPFERIIEKSKNKETIKGTLYYWSGPDSKLVLIIDFPLDQYVILNDKTLTIYYPRTKEAFEIKSLNPFILPFFQFFLDVSKDDFGLSSRGFHFARYERKDETLISFWNPPNDLAKVLGETVLTQNRNQILHVEVHDVKGQIISEISYSEQIDISGTFFPLKIQLSYIDNNNVTHENVRFENPDVNREIPERIRIFEIPPGTKLKSLQW